MCTSLCSEVIIAQLDPLIWLNAIFWWLYQHKAAIMLVADSFPHLNNSISEAASPAQGAQRRDDWQICGAVIHETRWARAEEEESELEVERENLSGLVLSSLITPFHCFPSFLVLFFSLLCWRLSWQYWTQFPWRKAEPEPFHHFIHWCDAVEKGPSWLLILPGRITNFHLFMALWGCNLEGGL